MTFFSICCFRICKPAMCDCSIHNVNIPFSNFFHSLVDYRRCILRLFFVIFIVFLLLSWLYLLKLLLCSSFTAFTLFVSWYVSPPMVFNNIAFLMISSVQFISHKCMCSFSFYKQHGSVRCENSGRPAACNSIVTLVVVEASLFVFFFYFVYLYVQGLCTAKAMQQTIWFPYNGL